MRGAVHVVTRPEAASVLAAFALLLAACGGQYAGEVDPAATPGGGGGTGTGGAQNCAELFTQRVQPRLGFCRNCHVPGGVADVADGNRFMLSANPADDAAKLRAAWEVLGGNGAGPSRILTMASGTDAKPHSGGAPWPVGSAPYQDAERLLRGYVDAAACVIDGAPVTELPLLGSARGGHAWFDFCEAHRGEAGWDTLALPADPRALVRRNGVNTGKHVYFNAWWKDCHVDADGDGTAELVGEKAHPRTCGELYASSARGAIIMGAAPMEQAGGGFQVYEDGTTLVRPGSTFAGDHPYGFGAMRADLYNQLWITWALPGRPENFDELVAERYGFGPPSADHPYPLAGEDPNATTPKGGSGRLPSGLIQTRLEDGSYSGEISTNCQGCHSTTVGGQVVYGGGGSLLDATVISRDYIFLGSAVGVAIDRLGLAGRVRGTNNAQFSNITALAGIKDPDGFFDVMTNGTTGTGDTPAWWNVGRRPVKFVDAMLSGDAVRVDFALFAPLLVNKYGFVGPDGEFRPPTPDTAWTSAHVQDGDHYILSRKSPPYPLPVDTALAESVAVLFHNKDLFAIAPNQAADRRGNGSCASCHGAYAPRYVNDPAFLADPALEGIASYVVPIELIGTDRVRVDTYNDGTNAANSGTDVGYPETAGAAAPYEDCGVQNLAGQQTQADGSERPRGYAAPPLYGVWATAPYFHNGSVPDVASVLDSSQRPVVWRRLSKAAPAGQAGMVVMGFETDPATGLDPLKLGWKYEAVCGDDVPASYECVRRAGDTQSQFLLSEFYAGLLLGWNITNPPTLSNADVENRKIYNTTMFSQGNGGHTFTDVLTAAERRAIVEYLKTL
jgi:hypothetical protein